MVFRKAVPIAASQPFERAVVSSWTSMGKAVLSSATTGNNNPTFLAFKDSISPDVYGTLPTATAFDRRHDGIIGQSRPT